VECTAIDSDIKTARNKLVDLLDDIGRLLEVDHLDITGRFLGELKTGWDRVNHDDFARAFEQRPADGALLSMSVAMRLVRATYPDRTGTVKSANDHTAIF
jgi:hypothetical protein